MSAKYQINRWVLTESHESPNYGKLLLQHNDAEEKIFFDEYELQELIALLKVAQQQKESR